MGGTGLGTGLTAQLAQQQQQLMAMVQTQSLLAAMQAQANANAQAQVQARVKPNMASPMGLLPTPLIPRNQSRDMQRQGRKRGRDDSFGRGGNYGNKRERFDNNRRQQGGNQRNNQQQNRGRQNQQNQQAKKTVIPEKVKEEKKEVAEDGEKVKEEEEEDEQEETAQGDEETEEANSSQEEEKPVKEVNESKPDVEFNDRPLPKAVNFIGEDVDALMISLFDKKRAKYICQQCKIICNIPTSFHKHLLGKRHARTILEKQGKELDVEEFKNFSMGITPVKNSEEDTISSETRSEEKGKEEVPQLSSPSSQQSSSDVEIHVNADFVKYTCDTRKTAKKEGNIITISSVTESRVKIDGFTSGRNMLGCEFVKAVSGFNCRLCKSFIRCGGDVIQHIKGKKHQIKYNTYIREHPQYEELQLKRNKELESVLEPKEGEEVLLFEVLDKDLKTVASKPKTRRKESQTEEVQITKFVIASSEEAEQIHCEPPDLDVDMDGLDQVNDDSFLADESVEEQKGIVSTTEEEDNNLYDPAEITAVDDLLETEPEMETEMEPTPEPTLEPTPAQPEEETEDFLPLTVDHPVNNEENEDAEETLPSTPKSSASPWKDEEPDTPDSPQEELLKSPIEAAPVAVVPMAKRGRKGAGKGGGSIRGGAARGRGRGRGARRSGRAAARTDKAAKAKKGKVNEETDGNEDVTFMEGFEIIDEIGDGED
ncbi:DNA ligase 1-like isoform X2 [Montipora foliosa]